MAGTIQGHGFSGQPVPVFHRSRGLVRIDVNVTTDASGDASLTDIGAAFGNIVGILYDGGLDASASITLVESATGATVFGPYVTGTEGTPVALAPMTNIVTVAGATVAAADTAPNIWRPIKVAGKLSVVVASGGNEETCKLAVLILEDPKLGDIALTV
jgi:hypothetical protein